MEEIHIETNFEVPSLDDFNFYGKKLTSKWGSSRLYQEAIKNAYSQMQSIYRPTVFWRKVPITSYSANHIELSTGNQLQNQILIKFMEGSEAFIFCAATIGDKFDILYDQLIKENRVLDQVILDMLANFLIGNVCETIIERLKQSELHQGNLVSNGFVPGETPWNLANQTHFFELLALDQHGLSLNKSMVMYPSKSETFALGWTSKNLAHPEYIRCQFCDREKICRYYNRILKCD